MDDGQHLFYIIAGPASYHMETIQRLLECCEHNDDRIFLMYIG